MGILMKSYRYLVFFVIMLIMFCGNMIISYVQAAIVHVPEDFTTIQAGIDAASNGDIVLVSDGLYIGTGNYNLDFKGKSITVKSQNGAKSTIIDCQGTVNEPHRGFYFHSGETFSSIVDGFTIRNGYGPVEFVSSAYFNVGGAIYCTNSSPTIINNIITGNTARYGGGIMCWEYSSPMIIKNVIAGNIASKLEVGGEGQGGGIYLYKYCSATVAKNIITGNYAGYAGGGVKIDMFSSAIIINNIIAENSAGGVTSQGGGLHCGNSSPKIINNTITGNSSQGSSQAEGGGTYFWYSYPTICNTILWGNTADSGNEISYNGGTIAMTYCDVQGWVGAGNINADPLFADPANGDYHLKNTSPCIGTGIMTADVPTTDIAGNPRPNPSGSKPDMGAYESPLAEAVTITTLPTGTPNPVTSSGTVNCSVSAIDSLGHTISYSWTGTGGSFANANVQNPVWTAPANNGASTVYYTLTVTATCTGGMTDTKSYQQGVYRPISIITAKTTPPGSANVWNIVGPSVITLDKSIVNNLGSGFGTTWIAWRWNPTLARWEAPTALGSNPVTTDPFDAGTSWFYALDGDGSYITKSVQGTPVDTSTSFSVPLKIGWNLICNPFDFSVAWSDSSIRIKYGVWEGTPTQANAAGYVDNRAIWYNPDTKAYFIRYSDEATPYAMPKTRGQWLYSAVDGAYVVFPPTEIGPPLPPASPSEPKKDLSLWKVKLTVQSNTGSDSIEAIVDKTIEKSSLHDMKPPSLPIPGSRISFIKDGNELFSDRQMKLDEMTWIFEITTSEESSLMWNLMDAPKDYKLTIENADTGELIDIRQMNSLSIDKGENKHRYILKAIKVPIPKITRSLANYPNPFNPETWIPYELSSDSNVVVKIYSSTGLLVRKLDLGQKSAGFYTTKDKAAYWDGRNEFGERSASGIYFYTIQADKYTAMKKMIIQK